MKAETELLSKTSPAEQDKKKPAERKASELSRREILELAFLIIIENIKRNLDPEWEDYLNFFEYEIVAEVARMRVVTSLKEYLKTLEELRGRSLTKWEKFRLTIKHQGDPGLYCHFKGVRVVAVFDNKPSTLKHELKHAADHILDCDQPYSPINQLLVAFRIPTFVADLGAIAGVTWFGFVSYRLWNYHTQGLSWLETISKADDGIEFLTAVCWFCVILYPVLLGIHTKEPAEVEARSFEKLEF